MSSFQDLFAKLKTRIKNLVSVVLGVLKNSRSFLDNRLSPRVEEDEIPESWLNPGAVSLDAISPMTPVAVEPSIAYDVPMKNVFRIMIPSGFMKLKRLTAFFLFLGCLVSSIGLIGNFPAGLLFVVPTTIINLDYLIKTQPKTTKYATHILDDVEGLKH